MSNDSGKPLDRRKGAERRTSPRYRLPAPPEVEILRVEDGTPVPARLGDLSSGGCFLETDYLAPEGTELTITMKKKGEHLSALAQVMRVRPGEGLGVLFTAMNAEEFRILESWLSEFVATAWVTTNRRRTQRVVMPIEVRVSGYDAEGTRFTEDTQTIQISGFGCLLTLHTPAARGKRVILTNLKTKRTVECLIAYCDANANEWQVGLAFITLNQPFWPVHFPPSIGPATTPTQSK